MTYNKPMKKLATLFLALALALAGCTQAYLNRETEAEPKTEVYGLVDTRLEDGREVAYIIGSDGNVYALDPDAQVLLFEYQRYDVRILGSISYSKSLDGGRTLSCVELLWTNRPATRW
jgi:hypothetical protein